MTNRTSGVAIARRRLLAWERAVYCAAGIATLAAAVRDYLRQKLDERNDPCRASVSQWLRQEKLDNSEAAAKAGL